MFAFTASALIAVGASSAHVGPYTESLTTLEAQMGPPIHVQILAFTCDTLPGWVRDHFATASCPRHMRQNVHISELVQDTGTGRMWTLQCTNCNILPPGTGPYVAFVSRSGLQVTILYHVVGDSQTHGEIFNAWPAGQGSTAARSPSPQPSQSPSRP